MAMPVTFRHFASMNRLQVHENAHAERRTRFERGPPCLTLGIPGSQATLDLSLLFVLRPD